MAELWKETEDYLNLIDLNSILRRSFDRMIAGFVESVTGAVSQDEIDKMLSIYTRAFDRCLPKLFQHSGELYQEVFDKKEMLQLIELQKDDVFKKLRDVQPRLEETFTNTTNAMLQTEINNITEEENQAKIEQEDKERQEELAKEGVPNETQS